MVICSIDSSLARGSLSRHIVATVCHQCFFSLTLRSFVSSVFTLSSLSITSIEFFKCFSLKAFNWKTKLDSFCLAGVGDLRPLLLPFTPAADEERAADRRLLHLRQSRLKDCPVQINSSQVGLRRWPLPGIHKHNVHPSFDDRWLWWFNFCVEQLSNTGLMLYFCLYHVFVLVALWTGAISTSHWLRCPYVCILSSLGSVKTERRTSRSNDRHWRLQSPISQSLHP